MLVSVFATAIWAFAGASHRLYVHPLDFEVESKPETLMYGIKRLDTNGKELFILLGKEPGVIQIAADGRFIRRIGRPGNGPGELGVHACAAMAVEGQSVWVLSAPANRLFYFESGDFMQSVKVDSYQFPDATWPANFAFNQDMVLLQVFPATRKLAAVYNYGGERLRYLGDILPIESEFLAVNRSLMNTTWDRSGDFWHCLFTYRPIWRVFNKDFEVVQEFHPQGPEIDAFEEKYLKKERDPNFDPPRPHFTDFKIVGDYGYFLSRGALYQLDLKTGETLNRAYFFGRAYQFEEYGVSPIERLHFDTFALLDSGMLVMAAGGEVFGHDLWRVQLPFLKPGRSR